jgi:hypothetical protein
MMVLAGTEHKKYFSRRRSHGPGRLTGAVAGESEEDVWTSKMVLRKNHLSDGFP